MTPLGSAIFDAWPYLAAFLFGLLAPRRQGWLERVAIGTIAVLAVAFISGLWPEQAVAEAAEKPPDEWPHLLNVIVFVPLLGALAVLFLQPFGVSAGLAVSLSLVVQMATLAVLGAAGGYTLTREVDAGALFRSRLADD